MRHYAFNAGDYAAATAHLSDAEDLAYRRLLDAYYVREAPLPAEVAACCRLARATTPAARKAVEAVLREFFTAQSDGWHQKRADAEIERQRIKSESARSAVNVRHGRDRESRRQQDERRQEELDSEVRASYERSTNVVRTHSIADSPRIPPTTHDPRTTTPPSHPSDAQVESTRASARTSRKTRLAKDWRLPRPWGEWAVAERSWSVEDVRRVADLFRDHWVAKAEARADWEATWRNWVRRERSPPLNHGAKHDARAAFATDILGAIGHEQPADQSTDITAESVRVA